MRQKIRLSVGLLFLFFAAAPLFREDYDILSVSALGVIALGILYREVGTALFFLWRTLRTLGKLLAGRVKKVEEMRYCKCCGALAVYMVTTCTPKPSLAGAAPEIKRFFVCREHHPNPLIGEKAEELHEHIRAIHPATTYDCVFPHNPY